MNKKTKKNIFLSEWNKELIQTRAQNQIRKLTPTCGMDFSSNDYLSLAHHPGLRQSLVRFLKQKQVALGGTASRLIRGQTEQHKETEACFEKWIGRPALFFSSGYMANMGVIQTVCGKDSVIFSDALNHASLIDACRFSQSERCVYPHKDLNALEKFLKKTKGKKKKVIITESLFSMDGDFAPIKELSNLALKHNALLIVDEAHAVGLYGPQGKGLTATLKEQENMITVYPCGKALCASGSFVAGPKILKPYLINKCRTFIYTTASSPLLLFQIKCVLNLLKKEPQRREGLKKKIQFFHKQLTKDMLCVPPNTSFTELGLSPIVPIKANNPQQALRMQSVLQKKGYDIRAIRFPTVPKGKERLRICIHYKHTYTQLKQLAHLLKTFF